VLDACLELARVHGFAAEQVARVEARVPPLVHHLVGRPVSEDMNPNTARLCTRYVAACALRRGTVTVADFRPPALGEAATLALARRVEIAVDDNPDANALTPVAVSIALTDGRTLETRVQAVTGNPAKPMGRDAELEKLARNFAGAAKPLPEGRAERLAARIDDLDALADVRELIACLV